MWGDLVLDMKIFNLIDHVIIYVDKFWRLCYNHFTSKVEPIDTLDNKTDSGDSDTGSQAGGRACDYRSAGGAELCSDVQGISDGGIG